MLLAGGEKPIEEFIERITPTITPFKEMNDLIATPATEMAKEGWNVEGFLATYWMYGVGAIILIIILYWLIKKLLK